MCQLLKLTSGFRTDDTTTTSLTINLKEQGKIRNKKDLKFICIGKNWEKYKVGVNVTGVPLSQHPQIIHRPLWGLIK